MAAGSGTLSRTQTQRDRRLALFQGYGLVLIDECHHVPAVSFEALLKACPVRKIIGLTATPARKDGLEKLLHLQCGPIRHTITVAPDEGVSRIVHVRRSSFHVPADQGARPAIHLIWQALVDDVGRANQVVADIRLCIEQGRCPLVLSDRKEHLAKIEAALTAAIGSTGVSIFRLESGVGKKQRQKVREEIDRCYSTGDKFVLLATAALVGEGYDLPRLDTLILAMPLSFKGRLVQYAGRLHRPHADKNEIRIYDYLDDHPVTQAMFRRRQSAYQQLGYRMELDTAVSDARFDFG
jgi:superfamily II DNA or RNA helicase